MNLPGGCKYKINNMTTKNHDLILKFFDKITPYVWITPYEFIDLHVHVFLTGNLFDSQAA